MFWYGAGGWWMGLWMVLFWVGVILLVVWLVRAVFDRGPTATTGDRAMEILEERLARGEIDPEEFEQRRTALRER